MLILAVSANIVFIVGHTQEYPVGHVIALSDLGAVHGLLTKLRVFSPRVFSMPHVFSSENNFLIENSKKCCICWYIRRLGV